MAILTKKKEYKPKTYIAGKSQPVKEEGWREAKPELNKVAGIVFTHFFQNRIDEGSDLYAIAKDMIKELDALLQSEIDKARELATFSEKEIEVIRWYIEGCTFADGIDSERDALLAKIKKLQAHSTS